MATEPWAPDQVKRYLLAILARRGGLRFSRHALEEMANDNLSTVDCSNVLRGGVVDPGEMDRGTWRYRVRTARLCVVVTFRSESECVVVTAWRIRS